MKKIFYPLFAVLTSVVLVLGGFSFSAQQGRFCAFEVQRAEAAVPLTAPYIFGALLGCFGVSVAGYAGANRQAVETALNNAWDSFQAFATADVVQAFQESFALFTSAVMPVSALNITSLMYKSVAEWLLQSDYISESPITYPDTVSVGNSSVSFDIPVTTEVFPVPSDYPNNPIYTALTSSGATVYVYAAGNYSWSKSFSTSTVHFESLERGSIRGYTRDNFSNNKYYFHVGGFPDFYSPNPFNSSTASHFVAISVTPYFASLINSSYAPISGSVSVSSSNAVSDVPDSISSAISSGSAESYGQAVEDAVSGQNINIDSATVENPAWTDVFGEIAATLESIQAAIESGFAGVLEGVQTFFRPVVEFFAPLDIRDSDDIGELVISNVSKEHTFTTNFPFCLVNDYKSLYQKAISPAGGSSDYPTPGHFVVKMPSMNGLNSQPITLDMTYIFTNKYMGLTLGQISQLFVSIACLAMFLHWVGDMINVVKSPNYGYVTVEGESVGRGR